MSVVLIDERIVHYEVLGRGRPVIFLHGWVGSWRYWVPAMQTAAIAYRAYALDLWGFGDTAHDASLYALEQQVNLLDRFLQELGIIKIALVGHGLGAVVGALFAQRWPAMVDRMMLVGCPLENESVNGRLRSAPPAELVDWLLRKDELAEPARVDALKADVSAMKISFDGLSALNILTLVSSLRTPCLLVYGESDPAVTPLPEERAAVFPEHIHQIVLENAGHFPMLDESPRFNRLLTDFLALESGDSPRQLQLKEEWKRRVR